MAETTTTNTRPSSPNGDTRSPERTHADERKIPAGSHVGAEPSMLEYALRHGTMVVDHSIAKAQDLEEAASKKAEGVVQQARDLGHATSDFAHRAGHATSQYAVDASAAVRRASVKTGGFAAAHAFPLLTIGAGLSWLAWSMHSQSQRETLRATRRSEAEVRSRRAQPAGNKVMGVRDARP